MNNMFRCYNCEELQNELFIGPDGKNYCQKCLVKKQIQWAYNQEIEDMERRAFSDRCGYYPMESEEKNES